MKKVIYSLALTGLLFGGLISCKSNAEKQEDATENVQEAKEELNDVQQEAKVDDATAAANKAEWESFKQDVNATISKNEQRIDELNAEIKKRGEKLDAKYQNDIDELKQKNEHLKVEMKEYETDKKADWQEFKKEFNSDMSDLGDALKNFTITNKK